MRRRLCALAVTASVFAAVPAVAPVGDGMPLRTSVAEAHSCARGTHAVVGGAHKCLARGQYCARAQERTYRRHGFTCSNRDVNGRYHLR